MDQTCIAAYLKWIICVAVMSNLSIVPYHTVLLFCAHPGMMTNGDVTSSDPSASVQGHHIKCNVLQQDKTTRQDRICLNFFYHRPHKIIQQGHAAYQPTFENPGLFFALLKIHVKKYLKTNLCWLVVTLADSHLPWVPDFLYQHHMQKVQQNLKMPSQKNLHMFSMICSCLKITIVRWIRITLSENVLAIALLQTLFVSDYLAYHSYRMAGWC